MKDSDYYFSTYNCQVCFDYGWVRKFEDRDVIEGYKLAPKYRCPVNCKAAKEWAGVEHINY